MPVLHAFMAGVSLMTSTTPAFKIAKQTTVSTLKWARMKLKPIDDSLLVRIMKLFV